MVRLTTRGGYVAATVGMLIVMAALYALALLLSVITGVTP